MPYILPPNAQTYINNIKDRSFNYITSGIWRGMTQTDLKIWLKNFQSIEETYFAVTILDSLTYRTKEQTCSLIFQLMYKSIPDFARKNECFLKSIPNWLELLKQNDPDLLNFRLVAVTNENWSAPGNSSHIISRALKQEFKINPNYIVSLDKINDLYKSGIKNFIFIDDIVATGHQLYNELIIADVEYILKDAGNIIYTPLVSHESGVKYLQDFHPYLNIVSAEFLKDSNSYFQLASDGVNDSQDIKDFYSEFIKKHKFSYTKDDIFGHGNLGLTYAFEHATPDNNILLLWQQTKSFNPLFKR